MRHEIRSEIHCGAECVIVQGPGSTAEDWGSPEAGQARSSRGPRTGLCDSREPIWGDRQGTEPPQHSKAVPRDVTVPTGLGFFCQRIQLLGKTQTGGRVPRCPSLGPLCLCHPNRDLPRLWGGVGALPVGCRDAGLCVSVLQGASASEQTSERENLSCEGRFPWFSF